MNKVRLRSRKPSELRAREVQGMFAMQGLEGEQERIETEFTTERGLVAGAGLASTRRHSLEKPERATESQPLLYRSVLADWPIAWRERWGRRANDLEDAGLSWRDAEGRAFVEVWDEWRVSSDVAHNN